MRIAFLTASVSRRAGGLFNSSRRLAQGLATRPGTEIDVIACRDAEASEDARAWLPVVPDLYDVRGPRAFGYAPGMAGALRERPPDIVHVQHLWMYPSVASTRWHERTGGPHIVSPRGMLDPVALETSPLLKRVAATLYERRHLDRAGCVHALSEQELAAVRRFGCRGPVCVVPNGVDLPEPGAFPGPAPWAGEVEDGAEVLLFLGRIHPKKGLHTLVEALERIHRDDPRALGPWHLAVAGWGEPAHVTALCTRVAASPLAHRVHLVGEIYGAAKSAALHGASAFVLPSLSEGMPMSALEAGGHALPLLVTPACGLDHLACADGAISTGADAAALTQGLRTLFAMTAAERRQMGAAAQAVIAEHHHWPRVVERMVAVYAWLTGGGSPPASVTR